jgi:UDP-N-acetyl-D-galactosamine dehydrogenase
MPAYVANRVIKLMIQKGHKVQGANVLVLGITLKENCPDIRNSKVIGVIRELKDYGCNVIIHDPWADAGEVRHEYDVELSSRPNGGSEADIDAVVLAVSHNKFNDIDYSKFTKKNLVIFDIKSVLAKDLINGRL